MRIRSILASALLLLLAHAARAEEVISVEELTARLTGMVRVARDLRLDAATSARQGRRMEQATLVIRVRQLARELARLRNRSVTVDGGSPVALDVSWIENRIAFLNVELPATQIEQEASALEQCLRTFGSETAALDRLGAAERSARLARSDADRRVLDEVLALPEFADGRAGEARAPGWSEQLAAWLQRLFRMDLPGWATRGSEALLAVIVGAGLAAAFWFLRRRREAPLRPAAGGPVAAAAAAAPDGPVDPAAEGRAARGRNDARGAVRWGCLEVLRRCAGELGPTAGARLEALSPRGWLARWRAANAPAAVLERAGQAVELHEQAWYGGRADADAIERLDRLTNNG